MLYINDSRHLTITVFPIPSAEFRTNLRGWLLNYLNLRIIEWHTIIERSTLG
jgi:hypothetical protein